MYLVLKLMVDIFSQQKAFGHVHLFIFFEYSDFLLAAPPAEAPVQENGEADGEVKEPVDPNAPKKCDVIIISGRKERCEAAIEALKVGLHIQAQEC